MPGSVFNLPAAHSSVFTAHYGSSLNNNMYQFKYCFQLSINNRLLVECSVTVGAKGHAFQVSAAKSTGDRCGILPKQMAAHSPAGTDDK